VAIGRGNAMIWNGPAGGYEFDAFQGAMRDIMEDCAAAKAREALFSSD
jgi:3-phosphoglycerate kinase